MINGVLRHCTEMEVNRQYVDTHSQSTVAFAFCRLLGFELMPRLKVINRQKLYRAIPGQCLPNLDKVLAARSINLELIEEQFDTMTPRDLAALSPLLTQHINKYGRFELDMETRLPLEAVG